MKKMIIRITWEYFTLIFGVFLKNLKLRSDLGHSYKKEMVYTNINILLVLTFKPSMWWINSKTMSCMWTCRFVYTCIRLLRHSNKYINMKRVQYKILTCAYIQYKHRHIAIQRRDHTFAWGGSPVNLLHIFRTLFFTGHLLWAASETCRYSNKIKLQTSNTLQWSQVASKQTQLKYITNL